MNGVTVDDVMTLKPCEAYTRDYVQELWQGKESLSLREILDLDIDLSDRLWVLAKLVPTEILPEWAQHCATKANEYATNIAEWCYTHYTTSDTSNDAYKANGNVTASEHNSKAALREASNTTKYVRFNDGWTASSATRAAHLAGMTAIYAGKNYDKALNELLTTLIEMTEEN